MNDNQKRKQAELADWLEGPFVKEMMRYVDAQIAQVESTRLLDIDESRLMESQERARGNLESLMTIRALTDIGSGEHADCFFPEGEGSV